MDVIVKNLIKPAGQLENPLDRTVPNGTGEGNPKYHVHVLYSATPCWLLFQNRQSTPIPAKGKLLGEHRQMAQIFTDKVKSHLRTSVKSADKKLRVALRPFAVFCF